MAIHFVRSGKGNGWSPKGAAALPYPLCVGQAFISVRDDDIAIAILIRATCYIEKVGEESTYGPGRKDMTRCDDHNSNLLRSCLQITRDVLTKQ
jgi:hypothetical protein